LFSVQAADRAAAKLRLIDECGIGAGFGALAQAEAANRAPHDHGELNILGRNATPPPAVPAL
jgi:hypothetical protein